MQIKGWVRTSLIDYPDHIATVVFTGGCNFRCPFCQNTQLIAGPPPATITQADVLAFLEKRRGKLEGVCVSGGEPLQQAGLDAFLAGIKALGYAVKLDTNGSYPARLKALVAKGLVDSVAMDIKSSWQGYAQAAGAQNLPLEAIEESVAFLLGSGVDYEFRTTVVAGLHTTADFENIGPWLAGARRYYLQGFVQSDAVLDKSLEAFTPQQMADFLSIVQRWVPAAELRGL